MKRYRILIADDEYWVRENLRTLLTDPEGTFEVLEPAVDGEAALARIAIDKPDILLTDIDMPFLTGNELIRAARSRQPALQIAVLSGYSDFEYVRQALLDGAADYLLKPVTQEALLRVMAKAVANLQGQVSREQQLTSQAATLQRAAELVRDEALSEFLGEGPLGPASANSVPELDLEFPVFTLLLVKLIDLSKVLSDQGLELGALVARVKALTLREASGSSKTLVFHNLRVRNEFLVLTDREEAAVDQLAGRLANLERFTGSRIDVAVSPAFYAFDKLRQAYRDAQSAFLARRLGEAGAVVRYHDVHGRELHPRLTPELERLVALALETDDKTLIRELIFDRAGLRQADQWLLVEVRQTVEHLVGMLFRHAQKRSAARSSLAVEDFKFQLGEALSARDLAEVCNLIDQVIDEAFGRLASTTSPSMKQVVRRVEDYIAERYCENLSLSTLAQVFHVDGSYLSKAFKQVTGLNLMTAIAQRRIEKAQEHIRDRDLTLTEVAFLVGYEEYAYFSRVFHKVAGESPSDYKNRHGRVAHEIP